jgi:integrase
MRGPDCPADPKQQTAAERALRDPRAPFERIATAIRKQIADGKYRPDTQLPGTQGLIRKNGASANTIRRAVILLREWGVVNDAREIHQYG